MGFAYTIDEKILLLRNKLNFLIEKGLDLLDPEVIHISQSLDEALNEYNKKVPPT